MIRDILRGTVDFLLEAPEDRPFRILQITDTQAIDCSQKRFEGRVECGHLLTDRELYENCFYYIEKAVERTEPDLILFSGDITYGEFDDSGRTLTRIIAYMESLGVPWAPVFGNHDNESTKGVTWQCSRFEKAVNCLFKRRDLTGNGNYTIGISRGGWLTRVIYMLDSNGCGCATYYAYLPSFGRYNMTEKVRPQPGFGEDQIAWVASDAKAVDRAVGYRVPKFAVFHIPCVEFYYSAYKKGYLSVDPKKTPQFDEGFVINDPTGVDFGEKHGTDIFFDAPGLWDTFKTHGFDGVFCGHVHTNDFSIVYEGVRLTFGLKTGVYDYHRDDMLGGTSVTLPEDGSGFTVRQVRVLPDLN